MSTLHCIFATVLVFALGFVPAEAQQPTENARTVRGAFVPSGTRLAHVDHAIALSRVQPHDQNPPIWWPRDVDHTHRRWPLRADPRRWPRLFANTSECTLSFDPVLRRHWW